MGRSQPRPASWSQARRALDAVVSSSHATQNPFLQRGHKGGWTFGDVRTFGPEYLHWITAFPGILAKGVSNARDDDTRAFLTEILFEELGRGRREYRHSNLFWRFLRDLGVTYFSTTPRLPETRALIRGMGDLYSHRRVATMLGAQYALEHQAVPMIASMFAGVRPLLRDITRTDIMYFELHTASEPLHARVMRRCIARYVGSPADTSSALRGARGVLNLITNFWDALNRHCTNATCLPSQEEDVAPRGRRLGRAG